MLDPFEQPGSNRHSLLVKRIEFCTLSNIRRAVD